MSVWVEGAVAMLVLIGAGFTLVGSIGLVRLQDIYTRLHGPTKATTLGVGSIILASLLHPRQPIPPDCCRGFFYASGAISGAGKSSHSPILSQASSQPMPLVEENSCRVSGARWPESCLAVFSRAFLATP